MDDRDPIPISALQHWCYCPRQCGLIHLEQAFEENVHTLRGRAVHSAVDTPGLETRAGARTSSSHSAALSFNDRIFSSSRTVGMEVSVAVSESIRSLA